MALTVLFIPFLITADNPKANFNHVEIHATPEAGASFFNEWPSGKTIHAATGFWVGTASGRGVAEPVSNGLKWPKSIIKQMEGYPRLPKARE